MFRRHYRIPAVLVFDRCGLCFHVVATLAAKPAELN
jgi:hypothetical protein